MLAREAGRCYSKTVSPDSQDSQAQRLLAFARCCHISINDCAVIKLHSQTVQLVADSLLLGTQKLLQSRENEPRCQSRPSEPQSTSRCAGYKTAYPIKTALFGLSNGKGREPIFINAPAKARIC